MTLIHRTNLTKTAGATFSPCEKYRYRLWRTWNDGLPAINFLLLNPSTADHEANDPTVERCQRRAQAWGYGTLIVTNLFAWRDTSPKKMKAAKSPIGIDNNRMILAAAREADFVVCGWGNHGGHLGRGQAVRELLERFEIVAEKLHALRVTKAGHPEHPLFVAYLEKPKPFRLERA
jgi:hypothetical protein